MEAGWSARRVARQLGRSDCVVKSRRENHHNVRNASVQPTVSSVAIQEHVAPSIGASVSSRTIRRRLAEGHLGSRHPLTVLPFALPSHCSLLLEWCHAQGNWTVAEWYQVAFSDEFRFNLSSDDNRVRVWRPRVEGLNPDFALKRHTTPAAGVMAWGAIDHNTWSPLVMISGALPAQHYVRDIMQRLPQEIFFNKTILSLIRQGCHKTVTILPWPYRSPDLSPIEHIWDHLG
ncbi:transposable element Tcb2 transposase [Trichonephila clavipes]|nr:transposable element Tcb2 transposase [Trichonephila clavipes]